MVHMVPNTLFTPFDLIPGSPPLPLADFVEGCASALTIDAQLDRRQRVFLDAGLTAVRRSLSGSPWTQLGLAVAQSRQREFYLALSEVAHRLLDAGTAGNFFYMHKPPGIRIRFEPIAEEPEPLRGEVLAAARRWQADGLVTAVEHGIYEPEEQLFGGKSSMIYVHRLFTADSLSWLEYRQGDLPDCPPWLFSLHSIRALLDGLGIVGWEDLQVWQKIRHRAGRRLPAQVTDTAQYREAAAGIRKAWQQIQERAAGQVGADLLDRVHAEVRPAAAQWRAGYFLTAEADVGPCNGAAIAVIFHWNRGGLSPLRQGLVTEALAGQQVL
jgi:thiopeptide-type bacteriocin biosynthesis protein